MEIRISPFSGTWIFCLGWDGRVYDLKACLIQDLNFSRRLWILFSHNSTLYFQFHALICFSCVWSMDSTLQYMYYCKVYESIELIKMYKTGITCWTVPGFQVPSMKLQKWSWHSGSIQVFRFAFNKIWPQALACFIFLRKSKIKYFEHSVGNTKWERKSCDLRDSVVTPLLKQTSAPFIYVELILIRLKLFSWADWNNNEAAILCSIYPIGFATMNIIYCFVFLTFSK